MLDDPLPDTADRHRAFGHLLSESRRSAGLSLSALARAAGIAKSNLSKLESGSGNPSLETLWALSHALNIPVSALIEGQQSEHADAAPSAVQAAGADYSVTLLSACPDGAARDLYRVVFQPGRARVSDPHGPEVTEHVVLLAGRAIVGPLGATRMLSVGDHLTFSGNHPHLYEALVPDTVALVVIEHAGDA